MKKLVLTAAVMATAFLLAPHNVQAATGIYGGYVTIGGTKYKSSSTYGGGEPTLGAATLGSFAIGGSLVLSAAETFTFQNNSHSTFAGALAYRVRETSAAKSTNPGDYTFQGMGDGVDIGGGDEKFEFSGGTFNLLAGYNPASPTSYSIDIVHKVGAFEGGSNFERLANLSNTNPGGTEWSGVNAFTASYTIVPEPSTYALLGLGAIAMFSYAVRRRKS